MIDTLKKSSLPISIKELNIPSNNYLRALLKSHAAKKKIFRRVSQTEEVVLKTGKSRKCVQYDVSHAGSFNFKKSITCSRSGASAYFKALIMSQE